MTDEGTYLNSIVLEAVCRVKINEVRREKVILANVFDVFTLVIEVRIIEANDVPET